MSDLDKFDHESRLHRIDAADQLKPGSYWRLQDVDPDTLGDRWTAGRVVMIAKTNVIDGELHSVEIYKHPLDRGRYDDKPRRVMAQWFFENATFEPDGKAIREREVAEQNARIKAIQQRLQDMSDPETAKEAVLEHLRYRAEQGEDSSAETAGDNLPMVAAAMSPTSTQSMPITAVANDIAQHKKNALAMREQAQGLAVLMKEMSDDLSGEIEVLGYFHQEGAQSMIAAVGGITEKVNNIQEGLKTLDAFLGKQTEFELLQDGEPAPDGTPIKVFQRLLYLNEETAMNAALGGLGVEHFGKMLQTIIEQEGLLDRLVPAERGLVSIQIRRTSHDRRYRDGKSEIELLSLEYANKEAFLLYRDGERVTTVFLPTKYLQRLFPSKDEHEEIFRGFEGAPITVDDLQYVDCKDDNEKRARHYKRILVAIWGMHTRGEVFTGLSKLGGLVNFVDPAEAEGVFEYVHDDELGHNLGVGMLRWDERAKRDIEQMGAGSMVIGHWPDVNRDMSEWDVACPVIAREHNAEIVDRFQPALVEVKNGKRIAKIKMRRTRSEEQFINATVDLDRALDYGFPMVVLDSLSAQDMRYYMESRTEREFYLKFMDEMRAGYKWLVESEQEDVTAIQRFATVLMEASPELNRAEAEQRAFTVIRMWRKANNWDVVRVDDKATMDELAHQAWLLQDDQETRFTAAAREHCAENALRPYQLATDGNGKIYLFAYPEDPDTRLGIAPWMQRWTLTPLKTKVRVAGLSWVAKPEPIDGLSVMAAFDSLEDVESLGQPFPLAVASPDDIDALLEQLANNRESWADIMDPMSLDEFKIQCADLVQRTHKMSKSRVAQPADFTPFSIVQVLPDDNQRIAHKPPVLDSITLESYPYTALLEMGVDLWERLAFEVNRQDDEDYKRVFRKAVGRCWYHGNDATERFLRRNDYPIALRIRSPHGGGRGIYFSSIDSSCSEETLAWSWNFGSSQMFVQEGEAPTPFYVNRNRVPVDQTSLGGNHAAFTADNGNLQFLARQRVALHPVHADEDDQEHFLEDLFTTVIVEPFIGRKMPPVALQERLREEIFNVVHRLCTKRAGDLTEDSARALLAMGGQMMRTESGFAISGMPVELYFAQTLLNNDEVFLDPGTEVYIGRSSIDSKEIARHKAKLDELEKDAAFAGYTVEYRPRVESADYPGIVGAYGGVCNHDKRHIIVSTLNHSHAVIEEILEHEIRHANGAVHGGDRKDLGLKCGGTIGPSGPSM